MAAAALAPSPVRADPRLIVALDVPTADPTVARESAFAGLLEGEASLPVDDAMERAEEPTITVVHDGKGGLGQDHLRD